MTSLCFRDFRSSHPSIPSLFTQLEDCFTPLALETRPKWEEQHRKELDNCRNLYRLKRVQHQNGPKRSFHQKHLYHHLPDRTPRQPLRPRIHRPPHHLRELAIDHHMVDLKEVQVWVPNRGVHLSVGVIPNFQARRTIVSVTSSSRLRGGSHKDLRFNCLYIARYEAKSQL